MIMITFKRKIIIASTSALSIMRVCKICPKRNDPHISHSSRIKSNHIYPFRSDILCHTSLFLQDIFGNLFSSDTYKSCYSRRIGCYKSSRLSTTISIAKVHALVSDVRRTLRTSALNGTR